MPEVSARLLEGTRVESTPAGSVVLRGGNPNDQAVVLVVAGLVRAFVHSRDGRQATARYAAEGEIVGLPPLLAETMPIMVSAVTDTLLVRLPTERFKAMASRDAALAWATARYLAQQVSNGNETLSADIFLPIRSRIARHLLDLAQREPAGLVVHVRHQHIADAIGSVREVVSREMKRLQTAGLLMRIDDGVLIANPAELHRIASGED
ncbi:hypothetical protein DSM104299_00438 [Baekduia alba]|uniref:Crp/Fnr family transcriptional regulator n=1 Tax=Baekduia alba TaxID=2997333 RepID=UPI002340EB55|nr:Crp/Fnr family transcriptional regulator [Baekduia alba]WCB91761.1 hypothetical protein DSM104299_00438 [Baekduia alba]